jgi:hypothetical protein
MDIYHGWFNLKPGVSDLAFAERLAAYMGHLRQEGLIEGWRLTRRKLGLGPSQLGEWHVMIEVKDLRQLEDAFERVASRREPVEGLHVGVNSQVKDTLFALYRDFPDPFRHRGDEKF